MKYEKRGVIIGDVVNVSEKNITTKNGGSFVILTVRVKVIEEKKGALVEAFTRVNFFGNEMRDALNILVGKHVKIVFEPSSKPFMNKMGEQVWFDQLDGKSIEQCYELSQQHQEKQMGLEEKDEDIPF